VTWIETLDLILRAIAASLKALLFVIILMAIFFYNYAIMGVFLFKENDPDHFGTLPKSFLSLFQVSLSSDVRCLSVSLSLSLSVQL
jgi:voltage-gated sodium channel